MRLYHWKRIILAAVFSALVLAGLFVVNAYQTKGYEYLSAREVIVRKTLDFLNSSEPLYIYEVRQAVDMLAQLGATARINQTAVIECLNRTQYNGIMDNVYYCILTLKALGRMDLMESLVGNASRLRTMVLNQYSSGNIEMLLPYIFVAQLFGWTDELNRTLIASELQPLVLTQMLENYGSPSVGFDDRGDFYTICSELRALAIVGEIPQYVLVNGWPTDFKSTISTFLYLRWDAYDGGFTDDLWRGHITAGAPQIEPSIEATYLAAQLINEPGITLYTPELAEGPSPDEFAHLCSRSQTDYGYFDYGPGPFFNPTFQVDLNYYAVSLLTLANRTQLLDEGHFRWPFGAQTLIENLAETGYLLPLIATIVILPVLTVAVIEFLLYRRTHGELINMPRPDQARRAVPNSS
jgi:hypothetical protein